jgi:hypothetical protein
MLGLKIVATGLGMMVLTIIIHALFMVGGAKMALVFVIEKRKFMES